MLSFQLIKLLITLNMSLDILIFVRVKIKHDIKRYDDANVVMNTWITRVSVQGERHIKYYDSCPSHTGCMFPRCSPRAFLSLFRIIFSDSGKLLLYLIVSLTISVIELPHLI
jgi:hypothetical protein